MTSESEPLRERHQIIPAKEMLSVPMAPGCYERLAELYKDGWKWKATVAGGLLNCKKPSKKSKNRKMRFWITPGVGYTILVRDIKS